MVGCKASSTLFGTTKSAVSKKATGMDHTLHARRPALDYPRQTDRDMRVALIPAPAPSNYACRIALAVADVLVSRAKRWIGLWTVLESASIRMSVCDPLGTANLWLVQDSPGTGLASGFAGILRLGRQCLRMF